jgi:hypothetical protein
MTAAVSSRLRRADVGAERICHRINDTIAPQVRHNAPPMRHAMPILLALVVSLGATRVTSRIAPVQPLSD